MTKVMMQNQNYCVCLKYKKILCHLNIISNDIISSRVYDKYDDFDFDIVNFHFNGNILRAPSYLFVLQDIISF